MNVESIPKFTGPAVKLWATVPAHAKKLLLSKVWWPNPALDRWTAKYYCDKVALSIKEISHASRSNEA